MIAIAIALLLLQEPPPPPAWHARYGPLTQCLGGYAVTASDSEAILVMDRGVTLFGDRTGFHLHVDDGDPYRAQQQRSDIELAGLGHVIRYQRTYATGPVTTYLIPPRDGHAAILVNGDFDGTERDLRILSRIARIDGEQGCGSFRAPAYPGETPDAEMWRPGSTPGPFFLCHNGVGFPILAGEALQAAWRVDTNEGAPVRLSSPNPNLPSLDPVHLVVRGPIDPATGTGLVTAAYRPKLEPMSSGPAILLMPPLRARIRYGQDPRYRHWIEIDYPAGQEAAARAFANRIEFVGPNDPRCISH